jgi:hypothetical protein
MAVVQEVVGAVAMRPGEQGVGGDNAGAGEQGGGDGRGLDLATVRSLNGVRVADKILRLVPDAAAFHTTLRCVKESTSCSEDSTAPRRRIIRRRLAASKGQNQIHKAAAAAASTMAMARSILLLLLLAAAASASADAPFLVAHKKVSLSRPKPGVERLAVSLDLYNQGSA